MSANEPNEAGSWDRDFSFGYLERLYDALRRDFRLALLGDAPALAGDAAKTAFVRHDLDVSLERALVLARKEREWKVSSTYHVLIDCPFYDVHTERSRAILAEIASLGHEVGLHYDVVARNMKDADPATRAKDIDAACKTLEAVLGAPVTSLSFHLPIPDLLRGPILLADRVSAYAEVLLRWYLSDSRARWREGEPLESLKAPRSNVLQILVHPIWWGPHHQAPEERLRDFVLELAAGRGESFDAVRDRLTPHILYRAADAT